MTKHTAAGWSVEVVHLDYTSNATGPVTGGCRPLGNGWQLLVRRAGVTVAYCLPAKALRLGVPEDLLRTVTAELMQALAGEQA